MQSRGYEAKQMAEFLLRAEAELEEMQRLWQAADECGRVALVEANPFYVELQAYERCQQSVVQARDSAVINEGQIIII